MFYDRKENRCHVRRFVLVSEVDNFQYVLVNVFFLYLGSHKNIEVLWLLNSHEEKGFYKRFSTIRFYV